MAALSFYTAGFFFHEDMDVKNDQRHPSHFVCSLCRKDLDNYELYLRRQFRHLVLVTSTGKENMAALSFYTAGSGSVNNQHFHFCYF